MHQRGSSSQPTSPDDSRLPCFASSRDSNDLPGDFPDDLRSLLSQRGLAPACLHEISPLRSNLPNRRTYRLDFVDGQCLKGRTFGSSARAERVDEIARQLPSRYLAAPIAQYRTALLEPWIAGPVLSELELTLDLCYAAGVLLGEVSMAAQNSGRSETRRVDDRLVSLEQDLKYLLERRMLCDSVTHALMASAEQNAPSAVEYGFVHGDLCPDNLVLATSGLHSIDNGLLNFDALEVDLARTWYRWPMDEDQRRAFLAGYESFRSAQKLREFERFWKITVLARAAGFHLRCCTGSAANALRLLHQIHASDCGFLQSAVPPGVFARTVPVDKPTTDTPVFGNAPSPQVAFCLALQYGRQVIRVESPDASALQWLREFLLPAFDETDPNAFDWRVTLHIDRDQFDGIARRGCEEIQQQSQLIDCFTLDGSFDQLPGWRERDADRLLYDARNQAAFIVNLDRATVDIVAAQVGRHYRLPLMRVLRELATIHAMRYGGLPIHGSVAQVDGQAILFTGPKQAGKTSSLIFAMQGESSRYVSNDRLIVEHSPAGPIARGMPTIVKLRPDTLSRFPHLQQRYAQRPFWRTDTLAECGQTDPSGKAPSLSPTQFCHLLDRPAVRSSRLSTIIFPHISNETRGVCFESVPIHDTAALLAESLLLPSRPPRFSVFAGESIKAPAMSDLRQACQQLAGQIPAYRMYLGPCAYESPFPLRTAGFAPALRMTTRAAA